MKHKQELPKNITREPITKTYEECDCDYCGNPLYTGDIAYYNDDNSTVFCSLKCAKDNDKDE